MLGSGLPVDGCQMRLKNIYGWHEGGSQRGDRWRKWPTWPYMPACMYVIIM